MLIRLCLLSTRSSSILTGTNRPIILRKILALNFCLRAIIFCNLNFMKIITLTVFIFLSQFASAQVPTIFIAADQYVSEVLTPEKIYHYPQFTYGKIFFRNNTTSDARLNYNYLNGEIEFIAPNNDTLAIAKEQMLNIVRVAIDTNTFFYNNGYLELVAENAVGKLLKKQMFDVVKREKIGGYGQPSSTSAIESYGSFTQTYGEQAFNLKVRENITLVLKTNYFFGDQYHVILPANKKNIYKVYRSKKSLIDLYLKENDVDFKKPEDLRKIFAFLANEGS